MSAVAKSDTNKPQTNNPQAPSAEEFSMSLIDAEPITDKVGIVGKRTLVKPPTVKGKSIYMEIPYWPTENAIVKEIRYDYDHNIKLKSALEYLENRLYQERNNLWMAGAICTCTSMVLEHYGTKKTPREILKNASGASYDPIQSYDDWWYDGIVTALKNKGYDVTSRI
jgi:hypothetical protein